MAPGEGSSRLWRGEQREDDAEQHGPRVEQGERGGAQRDPKRPTLADQTRERSARGLRERVGTGGGWGGGRGPRRERLGDAKSEQREHLGGGVGGGLLQSKRNHVGVQAPLCVCVIWVERWWRTKPEEHGARCEGGEGRPALERVCSPSISGNLG